MADKKEETKKEVKQTKAKTNVTAKKKQPEKKPVKKEEKPKTVKKKVAEKKAAPKTAEEKAPAKKSTQTKTKPKTTKKAAPKKKIESRKEEKPEEKAPKKEDKEEVEKEEEKYQVKKKPKIGKETKDKLATRKEIKKRTPDFLREEWFRYKRVPKNWRRPDGISSKMRRNFKYRPSKVRVGFRGPKDVRGFHPSGFEEVLVYNVNDLEAIDPKTQAARIGGTVGTKKRIDIGKKADELEIRILNM